MTQSYEEDDFFVLASRVNLQNRLMSDDYRFSFSKDFVQVSFTSDPIT